MSTIINGTSNAITFPDSSVQNTSAIVSGYVPYANLPVGSVLQVVQGTTSTNVTTTGTSFVDTGLTGTITPKFSTSKILVLVSNPVNFGGGADTGSAFQIVRGSTAISTTGATALYIYATTGGTLYNSSFVNMSFLDSPSTTSATVYKLQMASRTSGQITSAQTGSSPSTITLMEIAA